jgi:hypothetical protein
MQVDMAREADVLQKTLQRRGLDHLSVVKRGKQLTITCAADGYPEARLTCLGYREWRLDLPNGRGGWEQTPFVGDLAEVVDDALSIGRLAPDDPGSANQGDTSDPSH